MFSFPHIYIYIDLLKALHKISVKFEHFIFFLLGFYLQSLSYFFLYRSSVLLPLLDKEKEKHTA